MGRYSQYDRTADSPLLKNASIGDTLFCWTAGFFKAKFEEFKITGIKRLPVAPTPNPSPEDEAPYLIEAEGDLEFILNGNSTFSHDLRYQEKEMFFLNPFVGIRLMVENLDTCSRATNDLLKFYWNN